MRPRHTELTVDGGNPPPDAPAPMYGGFLLSEQRFPQRPALEVAGQTLSYEALGAQARSIAATLVSSTPPGGAPITAVFAYRSPTAFAGVLGALLSGNGYVALNRRFPRELTRQMLERSGARALVVDRESAEQLDEVLAGLEEPMLMLFPAEENIDNLSARFRQHTVLGAADLEPPDAWRPADHDPEAVAYLIFTSGSTGTPKAVTVPHRTIRRYVELMADRWELTESDRLSENFDMTFDLSVSDMFLAWERGACVCCPTEQELPIAKRFITGAGLTVWYSVPSTGLILKRLGMLKPGSYPGLRLVLSCGEALPVELAQAWAEAAPNAVLENVYGPTEVTITCANYRWDSEVSPAECEQGVVPIGFFSSGTEAVVLDEGGREVAPGEEGELYLAGDQVSLGYWRDPERTEAAFFEPPGRSGLHYKTGDRVRRPLEGRPMTYLGRVDFQVKISGHRVELGEVEAVLRELSGSEEVVALGWPRTESSYSAITAFVCADAVDADAVRERMAERLPSYMVPREILALPELPLNVNGKVDRGALLRLLEERSR